MVSLKVDFDSCDWQQVIEHSEQKECDVYSRLFFEEARKAEEARNTKAQEVFALLGGIASLMFTLDNRESPFGPVIVLHDRRSFIVDDLTDEQLNALVEIAPEVKDPEMQARIADVIWIRTRDYRLAGLAVEAYLKSATILEHPERWVQAARRVERALQLAAALGKSNQYFPKVIQYIEHLLDRYQGEDPLFLSAEMMELLLEQRQGEPEKYARYAEKAAKRAEQENNWHKARTYWEIWGRWLALSGNANGQYAGLEAEAETYLREAEAAANGPSPRHMLAAWNIQSAIEILRKIPGMRDRIRELHLLLLDYQQKAQKEMGRIETSFDVTELQEKAREHVKGKTLQEALFSLAFIAPVPHVEALRKLVLEMSKQFPFQALIPVVAMNSSGKTVGQRPSIMSDEPDNTERAIKTEMFRQAMLSRLVHTLGYLELAKEQINLEHNIRLRDMLPFVANNPLVPPGREMIYARGLLAGLTGDMLVAAHLLVPQLENSIRHLLIRRDHIVSNLDDKGIQDEFDLNRIFYDFWDKLVELFGEDVAFDLRGLLIERFGANLRNEEAHGLMDYDSFFSPQISYLWWLTLRLCCSALVAASAQDDQQQDQEDAQP